MKVTLFLMGKKGLESLRSIIIGFGSEVIEEVYIHTDKNVIEDHAQEIKMVCLENQICCYVDIPHKDIDIHTDFAIAISWRWIIKSGKIVIVLHDSLLPRYKGWNPLVTALINGDGEIGVSAFIAENKIDSGDIIMRESIHIKYPIKIAEVINLITPLYGSICLHILDKLNREKEFPVLINGIESNYSIWRDETDYQIDWSQPAIKIRNFVNAVGYPYQGAYSLIDGKKVRILDCEIYDEDVKITNREKHIGKTIFIKDGKRVIITEDGLLQINETCPPVSTNKFRMRFR